MLLLALEEGARRTFIGFCANWTLLRNPLFVAHRGFSAQRFTMRFGTRIAWMGNVAVILRGEKWELVVNPYYNPFSPVISKRLP